MSIEDIKQIMDGFDPAALLPDLSSLGGIAELVCRICLLAGPVLLLVLGISYLLLTPKEANYYLGYRCFFGMGSQDAWRFTQKLAGFVWGGLGLVLGGVMLLVTNGFRELPVMDQMWKTVTCLLWEGGLALAATLAVNLTAAIRFDRKGVPRAEKRKKK